MALQSIINLNVDFYDKKYIMVNAKQKDKNSRFLLVSCYNRGEFFPLNVDEHSAFVRYKKADGYSVFNACTITDNKVLVELTEQMIAVAGICYADLIIANRGNARIDANTGEIVAIDNATILSTMTFCVDVSESTVDSSDIESSYEFDGFNTILQRVEAEYTDVITMAKSYAIGGTGTRANEDRDNAKFYYELSVNAERNCAMYNGSAETHSNNAKTYKQQASSSEFNARASASEAAQSEKNAKTSETNAATSEANAKISETNAKTSENNIIAIETSIKASEFNITQSEGNALISENNASASELTASYAADQAKSYAVGGTGTRTNEDVDNAKYYYQRTKDIINNFENGFIPMGTIEFSELATAEKAVGFVYNIRNDFVTDDTFAEGAGKLYIAGSNVYCRSDGLWDCFGGATTPTASVDEVKDFLGI